MLKYNRGSYRDSLEKTKNVKKHVHTASIHLKQNDSYSDTYFLPLKEVVNKKLDEKSNRSFIKSKSRENCIKVDKSIGNLKIDAKEKENIKYDGVDEKKIDYKLKVLQERSKAVETDRRSFKKTSDKASSKTLRLKTDHLESYKNSDQPVERKGEPEQITISRAQMNEIKKNMGMLHEENERLKRQLQFFISHNNLEKKGSKSSVLRALER